MAEALVKRSKDLNFDGEPDIVETSSPEQTASATQQEAEEAGAQQEMYKGG